MEDVKGSSSFPQLKDRLGLKGASSHSLSGDKASPDWDYRCLTLVVLLLIFVFHPVIMTYYLKAGSFKTPSGN